MLQNISKRNNISRFWILSSVLVLCFFLVGCGNKEVTGTPMIMSFISSDSSKIVEQTVYLEAENTEDRLEEVLTLLSTPPQKLEYQVPLSHGVTVLDKSIHNSQLVLNLSGEYKQLDSATEILTRASLVKSLTGIEGINSVEIYINGEPLQDGLNKVVGVMSPDQFIDNAGEEISTYEKVTVRLYFTNETGDALVAVDRSKAYNSNISLDKFVVEELLKGPESSTQGVYPTINPDTKLISTLVKDNICYVNFDSTFLKQVYSVNAEIVIYSIVNSLCELSGIDRVQIFVDGSSEVLFREIIPLTNTFGKKLSYVQTSSK